MSDAIGSLGVPAMAVSAPLTAAAPVPAVAAPPPDQAAASTAPAQASPPDLQAAVRALNQHAQDLQTSLHFQVDKVTGQLVVSVIDTQNNQLLLQIPSESALAVAQSLKLEQLQLMKQTA